MRWRCNSCGGTYSDTLLDGSIYYHACPPEKITHPVWDNQGNLVSPERREPLPDRRDETPVYDAAGKQIGIRAEGLGRVEVST